VSANIPVTTIARSGQRTGQRLAAVALLTINVRLALDFAEFLVRFDF
jgi:hypothetical protein